MNAERLPGPVNPGAGNEARTRDLNLGKVALYQLSYSRFEGAYFKGKPQRVNCTQMFAGRNFRPKQ